MIRTLFPPPTFDGLPPDATHGHSQFTSSKKPSVDSQHFNLLLPHTEIPLTLSTVVLPATSHLRHRFLLTSLEDPSINTRHGDSYTVLSCHEVDARPTPSATADVPPGTVIAPVHHPEGMESGAVSSELFYGLRVVEDKATPPSPLPGFAEGPLLSTIGTESDSSSRSADLWESGRTELNFNGTSYDSPFGLDDSELDVAPPSPMRHTLTELHADDEDFFESSPLPQSPSRRSFSELPEDTAINGL